MKLLFWGVYFPLLKILGLCVLWSPKIRERRSFERKNRKEALCQSFHEEGLAADLCFEFSSEGEYQQVASLIDDALKLGKRIELVFFSPSVEKTIVALANKYPDQVRYFRYPLLTITVSYSFLKWVTSPRLILVRYDLFPEFLVWSKSAHHELLMVWVSFKKERSLNRSISFWKREFLAASKTCLYASLPDQVRGAELGHPGGYYDFRIEQIRRRLIARENKFKLLFPEYEEMKKIMSRFPINKRLLIGNAWPSDLPLFKKIPSDFFVLIVPHQLSERVLEAFRKGMPRAMVLNKKGVLCELYADFGLAYVGGGFEAGVHSILEPLVAGCESISCGKFHERSTEFDMAASFGKMTEVLTADSFAQWIQRPRQEDQDQDQDGLKKFFEDYPHFRKDILAC
jgi:3-deoxy-D-manno-octulosonic-acid transferase